MGTWCGYGYRVWIWVQGVNRGTGVWIKVQGVDKGTWCGYGYMV